MSEKESEEATVEELTDEEVRAIYESAKDPATPDWQDETVN